MRNPPRELRWLKARKALGRELRAARVARHLRTEDLSRLTGINEGTITKWEIGQHHPRFFEALELCDYLGVDFRKIVSEFGPSAVPHPSLKQL